MKIGLGIITVPNRGLHPSVLSSLPETVELFIHVDETGIGPSRSQNNAIKHLYDKGCTHIAILQDDVRVLNHGWLEYAVDAMDASGIHMVGLPNVFGSRHIRTVGEISYWDALIGVFHLFTRRFIDEVGYFNTQFHRYGFEDCIMQHRAARSGLVGNNGLPSPLRMGYYLLSEDVYGMNPEPSIPTDEKARLIELNRETFHRLAHDPRIYYPYNQD